MNDIDVKNLSDEFLERVRIDVCMSEHRNVDSFQEMLKYTLPISFNIQA